MHWVFAERLEAYEDKMPLATLFFHVLSQKRFYGRLSIFWQPLLVVSFVPRPKHVLESAEFAKYLCKDVVPSRLLVNEICSSCFVQWPLHGATLCLICSAKLGFVRLACAIAMAMSSVPWKNIGV